MEELKLMPDHLDLREVTFTNLLTLGFDVDAKEGEYRIPFNRDMFCTPNKKAMEVVVHFLFTKLDRDVAKETFRSCWFPHEKAQSQEFRKHCIDWLNKLKKQADCPIPMASPSLLLSPTGNKFYQFLFYFSMYVMKKRMEAIPKKHGLPPSRSVISSVAKNYTHQMVKGQYVSMVNEKDRLVSFLSDTEVVKEKWQETGSDLSKEHKTLKKKKKQCDNSMTQSMERSKLLFGKSTFSSKDVLKRTQDMQKVTQVWSTLSNFHETQKNLKDEVEHKIINNENGYCLDGKNIDFKLPDLLVRECERQMHMGNQYENIYRDGKIDVTSLLRLWNLSLHLLKEALVQYPLPDVTKDSEFITIQAHNHETMLKDTILLKHMLSNELTDLNMSREVLKEILEEEQTFVDIFTPKLPLNFSFDILPCTPGLKFEPTEDNELSEVSQEIFSYDSRVIATPDAVRVMLDKLEDTVLTDVMTPVNAGISKLLSRNRKMLSEEESKSKSREENKGKEKKEMNTKKDECKKEDCAVPKNYPKKTKCMRKSIALSKIPTLNSKIPTLKSQYQKENVKPLETSVETKMADAQLILIDQIATSIISTNPDIADNELLDLHAFEKPYEAFNADIFMKQDKVMRTPETMVTRTPETRVPLENKNNTLIDNKTTTPVQATPLVKNIFKLDFSIDRVEELSGASISPLLSSKKTSVVDSASSSWWCNTPEFSDDSNLLTPRGVIHDNTLDTLTNIDFLEDDDDDEL